MDNLISLIVITAGVSVAINLLLKRCQVESVIGYILTGMLVGYGFDLQNNASLTLIAEFGIVFLMFTIGLEFSPQKMRLMKKEVFFYGPAQLLATTVVFFVGGKFMFGLPNAVNLIVSLSLSLSSTAIVLNLLTKHRKLSTDYGRNSVGVLLFQDIAVIPILLMVSILASDQQSLSAVLIETLVDAMIIFALVFVGGRILAPYVLDHVVSTRSSEMFIAVILLIVVGAAQLAHGVGFTYSLGAFLAGMVIAESHYKHQVEADLSPFRDLLLGLFFITVGMQVDPLFVVGNLLVIVLIMVGLLTVKSLVLLVLMRLFNGLRCSFKTAVLLAQSGEFSFVVFETAQANNLFMNPELGQKLIMAIVMTMMLTPFVFRFLDRLTPKLLRDQADEEQPNAEQPEEAVDHVVVLGYGKLGRRVGALLAEQGVSYQAVEYDSASFEYARDEGHPVYFGNAAQRQMLEHLHLNEAAAVVVAMSNPSRISLVVQSVRALVPEVPISVCGEDRKHCEELMAHGVDEPINILDKEAEALVFGLVADQVVPDRRKKTGL